MKVHFLEKENMLSKTLNFLIVNSKTKINLISN